MAWRRAQRAQTTSVTTKISATALLIIITLATGLMFVMGFFMNSLTGSIMLETLQPMAKTAAQSIEGNLHILAERFFMIRDNTVISSPTSTTAEKRQALERILSSIEFTWIGLYEPNGRLLTGSQECPRNISGRRLFASVRMTNNLVIEDTSIGSQGPEITMGLPVILTEHVGGDDEKPAYYLVGGYNYEVLNDILHNIKVGPNGMAFIINNQGRLIAHKDLGKVLSWEAVDDSFAFGPESEAVLLSMKQGLTGAMEILGASGKMFVSFSPIQGTLWSLGIQVPRSDFTSSENQALTIGTLITVASIAVCSIFMTYLIRRILSVPLGAITDSADKLAGGGFGNLLPPNLINRRDEIGRLGATFITMSNSIHKLIHDIDRLTSWAREGKLEERADSTAYQGDYRLIMSGINATLDVFCSYLDAMPEALMFLDSPSRVLYLNRTMSHLLKRHGLDKDAPRLLSVLLTASGDLSLEAASLFTPHGGEGNTFKTDVSIMDADGEERNYDLSLWRVGGDMPTVENWSGSHVCVMLILNDVTQLSRARTDAEAASRAKSDFLATMSHEIRTPLNAIIGLSEIQLQKKLPRDARNDIEKIYGSGMNLLGIINDILDISKIETGNLKLILVEYDTPSLVSNIVQLNIVRIGSKNITFDLEVDPTIPERMYGDDLRIKQVMGNILSNAFKYTNEGRVSLQILWEKRDGDASLTFIVRDTGIGIRKEDTGKLFLKYSQLDARTNRSIEGTGLGLSITKRLVTLMNGTIAVESEYGKGSTFFVTIPQKIVDETAIGEDMVTDMKMFRLFEGKHTSGTSIVRAQMPYGSVLVVDDIPTNLDVAKGLLMPYGLSIYCAGSGAEAIEMIRKGAVRFDMVLMDHMMPEMDGIEATRIIRSDIGTEYARTVPIVALTANAVKGNEEMFLNNGFDAFISKPIDIMRLDMALNKWVRDKRSEDTPASGELAHTDQDRRDSSTDVFCGHVPEEIDFDAGVERYGSEEVYLGILASYAKHTPALLHELSGVSRETLDSFAVIVHGLKGSSYGICADEIGAYAAELEIAAKADDFETVNAKKEGFVQTAERFLQNLEMMLKESRESEMVKKKSPSPDAALLEEMLDATKNFDWSAMKKIVVKLDACAYESGGELVEWLSEQLEYLEYDAIQKKLEDVLGQNNDASK
ncbi:MAG: response regulator [Synergistaceae bacterium]|jgi:signal transduction histidine kinase/CheY-like chemotaxis protein|nr:response regulator [Synergistaceae bacterium]